MTFGGQNVRGAPHSAESYTSAGKKMKEWWKDIK